MEKKKKKSEYSIENYRTKSKSKRQKHQALGSIKSANTTQSNPDDSDSDPIFDLQALLSQPPRRRMFWCLEKWQGRNKERRKEGLKKEERKKKKKDEEDVLVFWRNGKEGIKKGGKKD